MKEYYDWKPETKTSVDDFCNSLYYTIAELFVKSEHCNKNAILFAKGATYLHQCPHDSSDHQMLRELSESDPFRQLYEKPIVELSIEDQREIVNGVARVRNTFSFFKMRTISWVVLPVWRWLKPPKHRLLY